MKEHKPISFGKMMLASALGMVIGSAVLSLLGFILMVGLVASMTQMSSDDSMPIDGNHIAVKLDLAQQITERKADDLQGLFAQEHSISMTQLRRAINLAAADDRVDALYLHMGAGSLDWAQAEELLQEILAFSDETGKAVYAYGESYSQPEYYLACAADWIAVHPSGMIDFKGIGGQVMFYKGLLDKLDVHVDLIRPANNAYKSAGETYTRTQMSDANREQLRSYISNIWKVVSEDIAELRGKKVDEVNHIADELLAYTPQGALEHGMIDTTLFESDMLLRMKADGIAKVVDAARYESSREKISSKNRIAVVYAEGDVLPGSGNGMRSAVYGDDVAEAIESATKNKHVKAIVLRVNSPGGAVTASEAMTHAVIEAKKVKPVIVSMSGMAASAGYEISSNATKIVAQATTLTGSIGVFATIPEIGTMLRNKLGVTTDTVMTNKNSTGLTGMRPLSPTARAMMQKNIEDFYITFTQRVADGRGLRRTYVDSIARGRVWTGVQAKAIGLVDTLGGMNLALNIAAEEAGLGADELFSIVEYPKEKSLISQLFDGKKEKDEILLRKRIGALVPFYEDLLYWSQMEPMQARLPFAFELR